MLEIVAGYHCMWFQGKIMIRTEGNGEKPHFLGPNLGPLGPDLGCQVFFLKILASSVTRYHGQLSSYTTSRKKMIQSWKNLVMDGQTDGQTDRREWFCKMLSDYRRVCNCIRGGEGRVEIISVEHSGEESRGVNLCIFAVSIKWSSQSKLWFFLAICKIRVCKQVCFTF